MKIKRSDVTFSENNTEDMTRCFCFKGK